MKHPIILLLLAGGFTAFSPMDASAVVCARGVYRAGCVSAGGAAAVARPVAPAARAVATPGVGAPGVGVRPGTPANRGGPVNRVGRR